MRDPWTFISCNRARSVSFTGGPRCGFPEPAKAAAQPGQPGFCPLLTEQARTREARHGAGETIRYGRPQSAREPAVNLRAFLHAGAAGFPQDPSCAGPAAVPCPVWFPSVRLDKNVLNVFLFRRKGTGAALDPSGKYLQQFCICKHFCIADRGLRGFLRPCPRAGGLFLPARVSGS